MRPSQAMVAACAAATEAGSATSQAIARTSPPKAAAVFSAKAVSRSQMAMRAPDLRKRSVIALPKPWAPPVTTAARPLRSIMFVAMGALPFFRRRRAVVAHSVFRAGPVWLAQDWSPRATQPRRRAAAGGESALNFWLHCKRQPWARHPSPGGEARDALRRQPRLVAATNGNEPNKA